ncbi:MAG: TolC family protein [Pirellulales bacterium]
MATALACRPDFNAAKWLVAAAQERAELARKQFWRIDGAVDTRYGPGYVRTGTGMRFDLPIFNRNEGGIVRADWELNAALHNRDAIRDQIHQDVRVAVQQLVQARDNLQVIEGHMLPPLSEAVQIARKGFADGGTDYLLILQTTAQYLDARGRLLNERASAKRAGAELERSISRSLSERPLDLPED